MKNTTVEAAPLQPVQTAYIGWWNRVSGVGTAGVFVGHLAFFAILYSAFLAWGLLDAAPNSHNIMSWDVMWYRSVAEQGYTFRWNRQSNAAFFPLFPYVWRYSHLGTIGISVLNIVVFGAGVTLLARELKLSWRQLLLVLSGPVMFYALLPYTEAFFFFFGALLLIGMQRNQLLLVLLGLFGCSLTRSASLFFIPAYFFAEIVTLAPWRRIVRNIVLGWLAIAAAVVVVMWLQKKQIDEPWAFYDTHELWQHTLRLPEFPLFTETGATMLWLDALALLIGLGATVACVLIGVGWLRSLLSKFTAPVLSKALLFSLGYFVGITWFILLYQGGNLVDIGRYVLATPFFAVLLWQAGYHRLTSGRLLWLAGSCFLIAVLCGAPFHMESFWPFAAVWHWVVFALYVVVYWLATSEHSRWYREIFMATYMCNLVAQAYLLNCFLIPIWIG